MTAATTMTLREALIYLRLSDFRDDDDTTFEAREAELRDLAASLHLAVARVVIENDLNGNGKARPASAYKTPVKVTADGLTTFRTRRPAFYSVLRQLQAGRGMVLIVGDDSRLSRDWRDGANLIDAVRTGKASVVAPDDEGRPRWILTSGGTPAEVSAFQDRIDDARKYSADIGAKVRKGRRRHAGTSYQGGRRPFGYEPDEHAPKHHKRLILVPAEAGVIRQAAADILGRGISLKAVARDLREQGVPTVTGTAWSAKTLRDVLTKPAVAGLAVKDGGHVPAPQVYPEPVLDADVWERLRDLLTDPARRTNTSRANEPRWLVSGFATCGVCGGPLRVGGGRNRTPAYIGAGCCHVRRTAHLVDALVGDVVVGWLERWADTDRLRPQAPAEDTSAKALRAEARRLRTRRDQFRALAATGDMDPADVAAMLRGIDAELAATRARLTAATAEPDPIGEFRGKAELARAVWEATPLARRRALVQTLIEAVVIHRAGRRGQGFDPDTVELTWQPQAGGEPAR
jgi:DNA invertase Pin-like site-specific DNA recombinase